MRDDPNGLIDGVPVPTPGVSQLLEVVRRLRAPGGCPWDREQTLETLRSYVVEESYELLDAIDSGDVDHHAEELGDVLLQVVLQSQVRSEEDAFTFDDVARRLADKLIRRHPHVFGSVTVSDSDEVLHNWQKIKAEEKSERESALDGVPRHMPSLLRAQRIQSRAARVGFDWEAVDDVVAKIDEELVEVREELAAGDTKRLQEEIGDLLFAVVNLCRFRGLDAEDALHGTVAKFSRRFREIERRLAAASRTLEQSSLAEMDALWDDIKREERADRDADEADPSAP